MEARSARMLPPPFWAGGPAPGQAYDPCAPGPSTGVLPLTRTLSPMVTGTSVLGAKFDGGVIIAADMLGSYGSLARFRGISRLLKVNDTTMLGASGDYADFQYLAQVIDQMVRSQLQPESHSFLADKSHVQPEVQDQSALEHRCHRRLLQWRELPGLRGHACVPGSATDERSPGEEIQPHAGGDSVLQRCSVLQQGECVAARGWDAGMGFRLYRELPVCSVLSMK
uniref:Proteasome subunit beta type-4 n=1 Tax=Melopsittacus undulatus TaxID=13146 RepID=A0A8V5H098_MELUD